jgi:hypothetical protein
MPVQQIELEEAQLVQESDEYLESVVDLGVMYSVTWKPGPC